MPRARRVRGQDARPTAHEAFIDNAGDDAEDQHPLSDEEDDSIIAADDLPSKSQLLDKVIKATES